MSPGLANLPEVELTQKEAGRHPLEPHQGEDMTTEKNCAACKYSFMELGNELVCGHPDAGMMGKFVRVAIAADGHCGPERPKFEQHPLRKPDGSLRPVKS